MGGRSSTIQIVSPNSSGSPENLSSESSNKASTDSSEVGDLNNENTTNNNTDIRTNSIATLRIKAKEHLDSINKNLSLQ